MQPTERMTALIQSCAKWREPDKRAVSIGECPLCTLYWGDVNTRCQSCPIYEDTKRTACRDTPYDVFVDSGDDDDRLAMYQYLRGLWKKEKAKCQTSN